MSASQLVQGRVHYLDALRATLMILGIAYHAALIYSTEGWIVNDDDTSILFDALVAATVTFRMPAFFMVSGFFALRTLEHYGSGAFVGVRFKRLALPLITTAVSLNSLHAWAIYVFQNRSSNGFLHHLGSEGYLSNGDWVSHLWFLNYLIIYFICVYIASRVGIIDAFRTLVSRPAGS